MRDFDVEIEVCKDFYKLFGMIKKRYDLCDLFYKELKNVEDFFVGLLFGRFDKLLCKNLCFVQGILNIFNVLGVVGVIYSVFREIFILNSGFC